ncbi:peptide chain release factor N(5)-glutamine methyltransferase [bacterium]|nr:peptide chain release factor N(5)-glutamine methyltransferase [bacterium]
MIASLLVQEGSNLLKETSENPHQESLDLLSHVLNKSRDQIRFFDSSLHVKPIDQDSFYSLVNRRIQNEPMAYIVQKEVFWERDFFVDHRVLVPRPETEFLIEHLFQNIAKSSQTLDLCCGSGILGITSALHYQKTTILSDLSYKALEVATINSTKHQASTQLIQCDLLQAFKEACFDLILCNPPYVTNEHKKIMTQDVLAYEPHMALFSNNLGLSHIYKILKQAEFVLKPMGIIYLEIGIDQVSSIRTFLESIKLQLNHVIHDFQQISRILVIGKTDE